MISKLYGMLDGLDVEFDESDHQITPSDLFYEMLLNHPTVTKHIGEDDFCVEIYQSLTNSTVLVDVLKLSASEEQREDIFERLLEFGSDQSDVGLSFRASAGLVAELRNELLGTSDNYMDWYCSGTECYLSPRVQEIYDEYGITWKPWSDK